MVVFQARWLKLFRVLWTILFLVTVQTPGRSTQFFSLSGKTPRVDNALTSQKYFTPTPVLVTDWPQFHHHFGQIAALAVDRQGRLVVFQRADRNWTESAFNEKNVYNDIEQGPISSPTLRLLDAKDGSLLFSWGSDFFYLPHGLTIDQMGYYWVTDVAMHQVFKLKPFNALPLLTLGKRFVPGQGNGHFCKPTSVAVANSGQFYVADGYCNHRILGFNAAGRLLGFFPRPEDAEISLNVPHSLVLLEHFHILCIADRDNKRVICIPSSLEASVLLEKPSPDNQAVYGVAAFQDYLLAINGVQNDAVTKGFLFNPLIKEASPHHWGSFRRPHAITSDLSANNLTSVYVAELGTMTVASRIRKYIAWEI